MSKPAHYIGDLVADRVASKRKLYEAIRAGTLIARKNGKRTVILDADLNAWLQSLPALDLAKAA